MPRLVRVVTVCLRDRSAPNLKASRARIAQLLDLAGAEDPDIICLPEGFMWAGVPGEFLSDVAEPVPGPTVAFVAEYARKYHTYIVCNLFARHSDRHGEQITNDAVLIDREGSVVGAYSKRHPVTFTSEFDQLEVGVMPGSDVPVFDTDFGRVGMQICFDLNFPDGWAELKHKGAELVFWPSGYDGGRLLLTRVWEHHYYLVSSVTTFFSRIISPLGDVLAQTGRFDQVAACTIDLDYGVYHTDFNRLALPQIHAKYGTDVIVRMAHEEDIFTLECRRPGVTVAQINDEFSLDPLDDYLARHVRLEDAIRAGGPLPDLAPRYAGRARNP